MYFFYANSSRNSGSGGAKNKILVWKCLCGFLLTDVELCLQPTGGSRCFGFGATPVRSQKIPPPDLGPYLCNPCTPAPVNAL
jgi:hypothetical protein